MKFLILVISLLGSTTFAEQQVTLRINTNIDIKSPIISAQTYQAQVQLNHGRCTLVYESLKPMLLKSGLLITGTVSMIDRQMTTQTNMTDNIAITDFQFVADSKTLKIEGQCFKSSMFFPAMGLLSLGELVDISKPYLSFSKNR